MTLRGARPDASTVSVIPLCGLDGSNPLGFLAALGTLRLLADARPGRLTRMEWKASHAAWLAQLWLEGDSLSSTDELLRFLEEQLINNFDRHPVGVVLGALNLHKDEALHQWLEAESERSSQTDHATMRWLAALLLDGDSEDAANPLQTVRRDYFERNLRSIIDRTGSSHLRRCLFATWDYADSLDNQSLHLNPSEDRRHALQWNQPSGDPNRKKSGGMLGANRLALEAIPLFVSFPERVMRRTVGFSGNRSTNTRWTWPVWDRPLDLRSVVSLLSLAGLQSETIGSRQRRDLREMGVAAAFRSDRILVQKTPNFTPARRVG